MSIKIDGDDLFRQVMATAQVKAAVYKEATRIAAKARRLDVAEGKGTATIAVEAVPTASGRIAYNVTSDDVSGEYGTSEARRLRTLRRAAKGA